MNTPDQLRIGGIPVRPAGSNIDLRFEHFIGRLRAFSRSGVARVATHISWTTWNKPTPIPEPDDWYLCRAFMPTIGVLGVAVCDDGRGKREPTEQDMRRLANDFLSVRTSISDPPQRDAEIQELDTALRGSANFQTLATTRDSLVALHASISAARDLRAQWASRAITPAGYLRAWFVAHQLAQAVPDFLDQLSQQWNIGLRDLLRCCFGLLAIGNLNPPTLGAFALQALNTEEVAPFGITLGDDLRKARRCDRGQRDRLSA